MEVYSGQEKRGNDFKILKSNTEYNFQNFESYKKAQSCLKNKYWKTNFASDIWTEVQQKVERIMAIFKFKKRKQKTNSEQSNFKIEKCDFFWNKMIKSAFKL